MKEISLNSGIKSKESGKFSVIKNPISEYNTITDRVIAEARLDKVRRILGLENLDR
jgi:hypothetical protein